MEQPEYKRTTSTDDGLGFRYETKMTALAALRLLQHADEFYLASNFEKADKFDDMVFAAKANNEWTTWFVQLKHKQVSTLEKKKISVSLLRNKGDFVLSKYFDSYKTIVNKFRQGKVDDAIFGTKVDNARFVLFTNAWLHEQIEVRGHESVDIPLLTTINPGELNIKFNVGKDRDLLGGMVSDVLVYDFIDKLFFCTRQSNEEDLDAIIQKEVKAVSSQLSPVEVKFVTNQLYDFIYSWCKTGKYLTKDEIKSVLSRTSLQTQYGKKNENSFEFLPSYLKFVLEGFGNEKLLCLVSKADNTLMCMTALKQMGLHDEPHKLLSLKQLEKQDCQDVLLADWKTKSKNGVTLVVDCEGDILGINKEDLALFIKQLIAVNNKNRVLLVTTHGNTTILDLAARVEAKTRKLNCQLSQLTEPSKIMLTEREVLFQGYKTPLATLMPKKRVLDDVFDMSSMTSLLQGRLVSVGIRPVERIAYYVTRVLTRKSGVLPSLFTNPGLNACFALSGITLEQACATFPCSMITSSQNIIASIPPSAARIVILDGDDVSEFEALSNKVALPVHWFHKAKRQSKLWHWKKSTKNIEDVSQNLEDLLDFFATDNIMTIVDKVVIITAEPGMGKSTLVDHLAAETKRLCPHVWVISLALNDYTEELDKADFVRNVKVYAKELIAKAAGVDRETSKFDARLFSQCYETTGNMIVLLDGFDEITPYYTEQGLALVRELQRSAVARVWVTARPVLREQLEAFTSTLSYTIKPFDPENQRSFLKKYWKQELPTIDDIKLDEFIKKMLELIEKSFDEKLHQFTGIPLQTRMLAEVFQRDIQAFHETGQLVLKERINGVELFQDFIRIKQGIQMGKAKVTVSNAIARYEQKRLNDAREYDLMRLALVTLLSRADCAALQPPIDAKAVQQLKQQVSEGHEKTGIVLSFKGDFPQFIHRTFAEYFVALFFTKNYAENRTFLSSDAFFAASFEFVKYFFDRILAAAKGLPQVVLERDEDLLEEALSGDVVIDALDAGGRTALHVAASLPGSEALIAALLTAGAKTDVEDAVLAWRPMQYAVAVRSVENIAPLLEHVAGKETLGKGAVPITWEALLQAVRGDYLQLLLHLLENGIYAVENLDELSAQRWIDDKVSQGLTILHLAAAHDAAKILTYLLRKDTRDSRLRQIEARNQEGLTPLLLAGARRCVEAATVLVAAGANSLAESADRKNLLQFALESNNFYILQIALKDAKARKGNDESLLKMPVTSLVADKSRWGAIALGLLLTTYPSIVKMKTTKGVPLLIAAARKGNELGVRRLWETGADVNEADEFGYTALHAAVAGGHDGTVQALLACPDICVDISDANGFTALYRAAQHGHAEIFQQLVDAGANLHFASHNGSDLTHAVASSQNEGIFFFLLEMDFDFRKANIVGETGLSLLQAGGAANLVSMLMPLGTGTSVPTPVVAPEPVPVSAPAAVVAEAPTKRQRKKKTSVPAAPQPSLTCSEPTAQLASAEDPPLPLPLPPQPLKKVKAPKQKNKTPAPAKVTAKNEVADILQIFKNLEISNGEILSDQLKELLAQASASKAPTQKKKVKHPPPAPKKKKVKVPSSETGPVQGVAENQPPNQGHQHRVKQANNHHNPGPNQKQAHHKKPANFPQNPGPNVFSQPPAANYTQNPPPNYVHPNNSVNFPLLFNHPPPAQNPPQNSGHHNKSGNPQNPPQNVLHNKPANFPQDQGQNSGPAAKPVNKPHPQKQNKQQAPEQNDGAPPAPAPTKKQGKPAGPPKVKKPKPPAPTPAN